MVLKQGDKVTIDGKSAKIECWWGAGAHRVFRLSDGRTVYDLHLLVESGDAKVEKSLKDLYWDDEKS